METASGRPEPGNALPFDSRPVSMSGDRRFLGRIPIAERREIATAA